MKRWVIKRKYEAFVSLDKLLRHNFEDICTRAGLLGLAPDAKDKERIFIDEFLSTLLSTDELLASAPVRQFLQVPMSRALFDLSNDPTRSVFSSAVVSFIKNPALAQNIPPSLTLADCILLFTIVVTAVPLLAGVPFVLQPFAASWSMIVCSWYVSQKEGLFDFLIEKVWGAARVPDARAMVRPADMPGFWMTVGVAVGFALGGHKHAGVLYVTGIFVARVMVGVALANFAFITAVANEKIKLH
jgi:hypothetical protein